MTWRSIIVIIISVLLARLAFAILDKKATKAAVKKEGQTTLHMLGFYTYFGLFCFAFGAMLCYPIIKNFSEDGASLVLLLALTFIALGLYIIGFGRNHKAIYTEEKVTVRNWKKKSQEMKWDEILEMRYIRSKGVFQIRSEKATMNCHFHLKGITPFLQFAQYKTNIEVQF